MPTFINPFALDECYRMLSPRMQVFISRRTYLWRYMVFAQYQNYRLRQLISMKNPQIPFGKENILTLLLMNPIHNVFPSRIDQTRINYSTTELQALVERDVVNCEIKSVFIATLEILQGEMAFLTKKYPSKQFHSGQRLLDPTWFGWTFQGGGRSSERSSVSAVQRNFQALVSSGIYSRLKMEMARNMWVGREPVSNDTIPTVAPLTMGGGIITIFMISAGLICLAIISFLIEGYKYEWRMLLQPTRTNCLALLNCNCKISNRRLRKSKKFNRVKPNVLKIDCR